jgi:hypothetical protein
MHGEMTMAIADEGTRDFTDFSDALLGIFLIGKAKKIIFIALYYLPLKFT